jgi:hypothetical protein
MNDVTSVRDLPDYMEFLEATFCQRTKSQQEEMLFDSQTDACQAYLDEHYEAYEECGIRLPNTLIEE